MQNEETLAWSENFAVVHEFEAVFLANFASPDPDIMIGDFYGDPAAAIIDEQERFVIMVGCGLIIYYLKQPFEPFRYNVSTSQWQELFREAGGEWWIQSISQRNGNTFHFVVDPSTDQAGTYELVFPDLTVRKIHTG